MPQGQPLDDDDDLAQRSRSDDFWIKRILKFVVLGCIIVILLVITLAFCAVFIANEQFRNDMLNIAKDNAGVIIVAGLGIIGVSIKK